MINNFNLRRDTRSIFDVFFSANKSRRREEDLLERAKAYDKLMGTDYLVTAIDALIFLRAIRVMSSGASQSTEGAQTIYDSLHALKGSAWGEFLLEKLNGDLQTDDGTLAAFEEIRERFKAEWVYDPNILDRVFFDRTA